MSEPFPSLTKRKLYSSHRQDSDQTGTVCSQVDPAYPFPFPRLGTHLSRLLPRRSTSAKTDNQVVSRLNSGIRDDGVSSDNACIAPWLGITACSMVNQDLRIVPKHYPCTHLQPNSDSKTERTIYSCRSTSKRLKKPWLNSHVYPVPSALHSSLAPQ